MVHRLSVYIVVVCPSGVPATVGEATGDDARALAAGLDNAPDWPGARAGCPSRKRLIVVVSGGPERVDIAMDAGGCGWASNGVRAVLLDRNIQNALLELARLPTI